MSAWIDKCNAWKKMWDVFNEPHTTGTELNIYEVIAYINKYSENEAIIMGDAGSISYIGPVAIKPIGSQRVIFNPAQADMGWAVPASTGVSLASNKPVIAITGDGSFMMNMQELAVIKEHNLNIKIIVLNNNGYLSIRNTQNNYFKNSGGTDSSNGLRFPSFQKIAESFEIQYQLVKTKDDLIGLFKGTEPKIIECMCLSNQQIMPSQALKNGKQAGLHDMYPFLPDEQLEKEMIQPIKEI